MEEKELRNKIVKGYMMIAYVLFALVIVAFWFLYENIFTGQVSLAIDINRGVAGWKIAVFAGLFFGMIYLIYYFLIKEVR